MSGVSRPLNPFYNHDAVRDASMFFGREDELRLLLDAIDKRQCCSMVGSRHIGKSTLLQHIGDGEIQKRFGYDMHDRIFILTDWREFLQKTQDDFYRTLCDRIISQSSHMLSLQLQPSAFNLQEQFKKLLEDMRRAKFRPVLLMDVFDTVTRNPAFDPVFFSFLRSLAGISDLITYIIATIKPLHEVCHSDEVASSPFFNIFYQNTIGPLTQEEARQLITVPAQRAKYHFTDEEVAWVLTVAGRHPFFIQVTCRHLFEAKLHEQHETVHLETVEQHVYHELVPHFDKIWNDLNEDQKERFKLRIPNTVYPGQKFSELSESTLFCKRVHELLLRSASIITSEDVKDALDNFANDDFLEGCELSKTHYILLRAKGRVALSNTLNGILVRDFLQAALVRMKPHGIHNDLATDWRLYNVLWYHYFKHHLTSEQIAARLGISRRQYHREQNKAIRALWKVLLEMETDSLNEWETQLS